MSKRLRLILWYAGAVGALGAMPYIAVVLSDKGLSDPQIALFVALFPASSLFAAPLWSWVADRSGRADRILTATAVGTTIGFAGLALFSSPLWLFAALALYAFARSPQTPMVDALAVRTLNDGGESYGRVRLWGSVAFLVVGFAAGWLRESVWATAPIALGTVLLATTIVASRILPHDRSPPPRPSTRELFDLFQRPSSALLAISCIFHGVGLAFYNNFLGTHVESLGLPSTVVGTCIVVAVAAEVVVMAVAPRLLSATRPSVLMVVSFALSVPRWLGTAIVSDPSAFIALQALHGVSFGLLGVINHPVMRAPPGQWRRPLEAAA